MSSDSIDVAGLLKRKNSCVKVVTTSKYERTNPDVQNWWHRLFNKLEETHTVPFYKRETNLEKCFSRSSLKKLKQMGIEVQEEKKDDYIIYKENDMFETSDIESASKKDDESDSKSSEVPCNPYLSFLRKPKKRARIWRPSKEPSLAELKLMEKAETATDRIASQFDDYIQNMGGQTKTQINKKAILELFEITFNYPPAKALYVKTRLRNCVPEQVAEALQRPEFSKVYAIWREVFNDIKVDSKNIKNVAFGKTLPEEMRQHPVRTDVKEKWANKKYSNEDLDTMSAVWKDITHLQSTVAFCQWLLANESYCDYPKYLQDIGMCDPCCVEKTLANIRSPGTCRSYRTSLDELQEVCKRYNSLEIIETV